MRVAHQHSFRVHIGSEGIGGGGCVTSDHNLPDLINGNNTTDGSHRHRTEGNFAPFHHREMTATPIIMTHRNQFFNSPRFYISSVQSVLKYERIQEGSSATWRSSGKFGSPVPMHPMSTGHLENLQRPKSMSLGMACALETERLDFPNTIPPPHVDGQIRGMGSRPGLCTCSENRVCKAAAGG